MRLPPPLEMVLPADPLALLSRKVQLTREERASPGHSVGTGTPAPTGWPPAPFSKMVEWVLVLLPWRCSWFVGQRKPPKLPGGR